MVSNMYLEGNYAPVAEEITAFDLPVIGALPEQFEGRYLRNGPNPWKVDDPGAHHWFVGAGMVHGVRLRGGRAEWYRNRYVGSRELSMQRGQPDIPGPNWNNNGNGPNTNVGGFAGTTWAMVEAGGVPVEMTYDLETVGRNDFFGTLPGGFTAHPKVDPDTGEMHAMVYSLPEWLDHVQYVVVAADGKVRRTVDIPLPAPTMLHDMSLTERYAVVYDFPCRLDIELAMSGRFPFSWQRGTGSRVGLLPREGEAADIIWVDVPECYAFHPMNAHDAADGSVVIDLCVYDSMFDVHRNGPFQENLARLERWVVNPTTRTASTALVDGAAQEFPRHAGRLTAKPYRYGYASGVSAASPTWPTIKHDLQTGEKWTFDHGAGRSAGEAVFIGRHGATAEDDGWLMMLVHDLNNDTAELVVLDAQDFSRDAVARVLLPQRVPFGFHGNWVSDRSVPPPN
ncbi:MAG: 8-apo-carotenoid 13,14-cleaving dioxygenase [Acidimicrobiales bacterium]|nr:8-apo-carotenoid 13,14-cleaving dioxygenase [Acidimicrobiales bacterium]